MNMPVSPDNFRNEIIECLAKESIKLNDINSSDKYKEAETYLKNVFMEADGNYDYPTYPKLMAVLKLLLSKEYKAGKDKKVVAQNFLKISKKIKAVCSETL